MTVTAFPEHVVSALDRYQAPPLPYGFTERLLAKVAAGTLPDAVEPALPPLPPLRKSPPWRRAGRILGSVAAISLVTATAAASGLLGERVHIPYISDILVSTKLVVAEKRADQNKVQSANAVTTEAAPVAEAEPVTGTAAVKEMHAKLRNDPEFRALTPAQKAARLKMETRALIAAGQATPADIRAVRKERIEKRREKIESNPTAQALKQKAEEWRERYREASPEERAAMIEEAKSKRAERLARRQGENVVGELPGEE